MIRKHVVTGDGGIEDFNEELLFRWLGSDRYPEMSVRSLASWFNIRLLKSVYRDHGRKILDTHVSTDYDVLSSDDPIEKENLRDDLAADGIDARAIESDFVSAPTVYRHLTNCLSGEKTTGNDEPSNWARDKVDYAQQLAEEEIHEALSHFDNRGDLPGGSTVDVDVTITLSCPECSTSTQLARALNRGYVCREHLGG